MKWSKQRSFASNKVVKSSAIWLIIVPVAAKFLSSVKDILEVRILGETIKITTTLPFSWQILFFAACAFSIAGIVYSVFCPSIVKGYKNYTEFKADGKSRMQINYAFKSIVMDINENSLKEEYKNKLFVYMNRYIESESDKNNYKQDDIIGVLEDISRSKGEDSDAFYYVVYIADEYNPLAIKFSMILYLTGYLLISVLAIQNIAYVYDSINW